LAQKQSDKPGSVIMSDQPGEEQGDVSRNGAGADLLVVRLRGFANMTERLNDIVIEEKMEGTKLSKNPE
jgi:hypothetical protein